MILSFAVSFCGGVGCSLNLYPRFTQLTDCTGNKRLANPRKLFHAKTDVPVSAAALVAWRCHHICMLLEYRTPGTVISIVLIEGNLLVLLYWGFKAILTQRLSMTQPTA